MSKQFSVFTATFSPQRVDDLQGMARANVGVTLRWRREWIIGGGLYAGQWACLPADSDESFGWVPECDLTPCTPDTGSEP